MSVTSDPSGAIIYVDGEPAGRTPVTLHLASRPHRLRLVKDGYLENNRVVTPSDPESALRVRLTARPQAGDAQQGLKIVVVDGEAAINVIERKTATAPVVEVRDRNDQPVAAALVIFLIRGGRQRATFANGTTEVQVTTNATGRAIAPTLTPTGRGTLDIEVRAEYQGQSASVTIHQRNVLTPDEAARATTTGGATAAGGGLSHGVAAAIAAGAVAGTAGAGLAVQNRKTTPTPALAAAIPATVGVDASPNPVPWGGLTQAATPGCFAVANSQGIVDIWNYQLRFIETNGVAVHFTRVLNIAGGEVIQDLAADVTIPAGSTVVVPAHRCGSPSVIRLSAGQTQDSYSGTDANGHAITVLGPVITLAIPSRPPQPLSSPLLPALSVLAW